MEKLTIGFIGSGRVTAFMIEGLLGKGANVDIAVQDANPDISASLAKRITVVADQGADIAAIGASDIVFLALHPQNVQAGCESVAPFLGKDTIAVSLAPKATLASVARWTGTDKVARYLPNAATGIGKGHNPVVWGSALSGKEKATVGMLLALLGDMPEVDEPMIETYAVLSAMGPTYLWPLLDEMIECGKRYGLDATASARLVSRMAAASAEMIELPGMDYATRMNMIPAKPMADVEGEIRSLFRSKIDAIHAKLTT